MEKQFIIDETIAERIITSKVIIDEALVPFKGVEVSYVGYTDADGDAWTWDESGEEFAIVSFKAMNPHQLATAVEEFEAGDYEASANHNLSMRMPVDKAREIIAGATSGTLVCHNVEIEDEETGETIVALLPKNFIPAVAKEAKRASLKDILAKRAEKREDAEEPKEEPKAETKKVKLAGAK